MKYLLLISGPNKCCLFHNSALWAQIFIVAQIYASQVFTLKSKLRLFTLAATICHNCLAYHNVKMYI